MIISTETGGLGNRIKSWVSASRLASDARVFWPLTDNMPARFSDLFENSCVVESLPAEFDEYKSWRLTLLPEDEECLPERFAVVGAGAHPIIRGAGKLWWRIRGRPDERYRYMLFPKQHSRRSTRSDARHIDLEYGRIPAELRRAYVPLFRSIRVRAEIAARAQEWANAWLAPEVIGVQVRTWRDYAPRYRKYHLPARKRLLTLMSDADPASRFFVVSDSDDIEPFLTAEFGRDRILTFPRKTSRQDSWQSPEGVVEDLIDMLLLSRTQRIFASYLSTFSETAWWLGGATAAVDVF